MEWWNSARRKSQCPLGCRGTKEEKGHGYLDDLIRLTDKITETGQRVAVREC